MGKYEAQERYDREHTVRFSMKLNKVSDADIIQKLKTVDRKQTYIKKLIRADISADADDEIGT